MTHTNPDDAAAPYHSPVNDIISAGYGKTALPFFLCNEEAFV